MKSINKISGILGVVMLAFALSTLLLSCQPVSRESASGPLTGEIGEEGLSEDLREMEELEGIFEELEDDINLDELEDIPLD